MYYIFRAVFFYLMVYLKVLSVYRCLWVYLIVFNCCKKFYKPLYSILSPIKFYTDCNFSISYKLCNCEHSFKNIFVCMS